MSKSQDMKFLLKSVYWLAISGAAALVFYIGWQAFVTIYSGTH